MPGAFVINPVSKDTLDAMTITAIEFPPEVKGADCAASRGRSFVQPIRGA